MCDFAESVHADLLAEVDRLEPQVRDPTHSARLLAPWDHFTRGLRLHFGEEERELFPALRQLDTDGAAPPEPGRWQELLAEMERELDEVRTIADALREAARDAGDLETPLLDLLDKLEAHAEGESTLLLPAARRKLDPTPAAAPQAARPPSPPPERPSRLRRVARRLRDMVRGRS